MIVTHLFCARVILSEESWLFWGYLQIAMRVKEFSVLGESFESLLQTFHLRNYERILYNQNTIITPYSTGDDDDQILIPVFSGRSVQTICTHHIVATTTTTTTVTINASSFPFSVPIPTVLLLFFLWLRHGLFSLLNQPSTTRRCRPLQGIQNRSRIYENRWKGDITLLWAQASHHRIHVVGNLSWSSLTVNSLWLQSFCTSSDAQDG